MGSGGASPRSALLLTRATSVLRLSLLLSTDHYTPAAAGLLAAQVTLQFVVCILSSNVVA